MSGATEVYQVVCFPSDDQEGTPNRAPGVVWVTSGILLGRTASGARADG